MRQLNSRKPMGFDMIPSKITKMLNDNICDNIESIANSMITQLLLPDQAKISSITPVFKKDIRMEKRITDQSVYSVAFQKYWKR